MRSRKESVSGSQHFFANIKDVKVLLSGSQNFVLPLAENYVVCAKSQTLMLENVFEETEKELPHATNKHLDILCFSFVDQT